MYIFYGLIVIVVIIAYLRVQKATGEIANEEEVPESPVTKKKRKAKQTEYLWTYSGDGGGSDIGGFDGGGSQGGDGSSTHF
jgi:uncharacterized membrane protein YgcG